MLSVLYLTRLIYTKKNYVTRFTYFSSILSSLPNVTKFVLVVGPAEGVYGCVVPIYAYFNEALVRGSGDKAPCS